MPLLLAGSHLFNSSVKRNKSTESQAVSAAPTFAVFIPDCLFLRQFALSEHFRLPCPSPYLMRSSFWLSTNKRPRRRAKAGRKGDLSVFSQASFFTLSAHCFGFMAPVVCSPFEVFMNLVAKTFHNNSLHCLYYFNPPPKKTKSDINSSSFVRSLLCY